MAPITASGKWTRGSGSPYLHTCVHLTSGRSLGSRNSEPGLPPPCTADCTDRFLQETKIWTAWPPSYQQCTQLHLQDSHSCTMPEISHAGVSLFLCSSSNWTACRFCSLKPPIDPVFPPSHWLSFLAESLMSYRIQHTRINSSYLTAP